MKTIFDRQVLGNISTHQWGVVISRENVLPAQTASQHKYPPIVVRKWEKSQSSKLHKQETHELTLYAKRTIVIGQMDNTIDHTFESANRVYEKRGTCPTIPTCGGGGLQPKVVK